MLVLIFIKSSLAGHIIFGPNAIRRLAICPNERLIADLFNERWLLANA